jgi:hypothetical protein
LVCIHCDFTIPELKTIRDTIRIISLAFILLF